MQFQDEKNPVNDIQDMDFYTLMRYLTPPNNQYHGCHLLFTDTVFIDKKEGKPVEIINTNKDGFLSSIKKDKRLKYNTI